MKIFNLTENTVLDNLNRHKSENQYFILATEDEFREVSKVLDVHILPQKIYGNMDENIRRKKPLHLRMD